MLSTDNLYQQMFVHNDETFSTTVNNCTSSEQAGKLLYCSCYELDWRLCLFYNVLQFICLSQVFQIEQKWFSDVDKWDLCSPCPGFFGSLSGSVDGGPSGFAGRAVDEDGAAEFDAEAEGQKELKLAFGNHGSALKMLPHLIREGRKNISQT